MRLQGSKGDGSSRDSVVAEAAEWFATLSDGGESTEERQSFVAWLRRSNLHVEEFLRVSGLARELSRPSLWPAVSREELIAQALASTDGIVEIGRSRRTNEPVGRVRPSRARWARPWLLTMAAVSAAAALAVVVFVPRWSVWNGTRYTTSVGEMRSIVLADGSVVELNTRSSLITRFTDSVREVELERGEAIFKVAKNAARPFRVSTGSTEILALGTAFNVYAASSRTVVTVLEGRVRVSDHSRARGGAVSVGARQMELSGGEQAVIAPNRPIARVALADPAKVTLWTERRLIFEDTSLATAAEEFARYSGRRIRIEDPALAARQITGVFDASDPASLVQFLALQGDVAIREASDGWVLADRETGATPAFD